MEWLDGISRWKSEQSPKTPHPAFHRDVMTLDFCMWLHKNFDAIAAEANGEKVTWHYPKKCVSPVSEETDSNVKTRPVNPDLGYSRIT